MTHLPEAEWREREQHHRERLRPWVDPHLERQSKGRKHPIYDFLFEYYSFRPAQLLRWSPGHRHVLAGESARQFLCFPEFVQQDDGVRVNPKRFPPQRKAGLQWVIDLLHQTLERPPRFGCYGLHEWAMVYDARDTRHRQLPLRVEHRELVQFLDEQPVCCSHYDAFRFFSNGARELNRLHPTRETQAACEQSGCLHANMDLYKWAYKYAPWTPGEFIAGAFELAVRLRELDMRASPYDLADLGFSPIAIETPGGREVYQQMQQALSGEAQVLRQGLLTHYEDLLERAP